MNSRWTKAATYIFYLGLARAMAVFWTCHIPVFKSSMIPLLLNGKGGYPAQYRMLGPWIIGFLANSLHIHLLSAQMIFYWLAFFAAFLAMRYWLKPFVPKAISDLAPVWLIPLIIGNVALRYPWDALTFVFIPLLLGLLYRKRWDWFVIVFAVGTLSRETTLLALLAMAILMLYWREDRRKMALVGLLCGLIWVAERYAILAFYGKPVSTAFVWQLKTNIRFLTGKSVPIDEPAILARLVWRYKGTGSVIKRMWIFYTYPLSLLSFLGWANFAWILIFPRWRRKDPFLRRIAWLIPIHIAIMLFVGILFEKRIYFELYPIVIALGLQTFFDQPQQPQNRNTQTSFSTAGRNST